MGHINYFSDSREQAQRLRLKIKEIIRWESSLWNPRSIWDSLLSIVQIPGGVPVATVGFNNANNVGLLAVKMLGINNDLISTKHSGYREEIARQFLTKKI